ncbi:MAG: N-acetyltransferase family protein [Paludibacter sp.]|jgi:phosphinothricin acetyltransferase
MEFQLKDCTEKQLPEILAIFNEAILNSTALYDYKPRTLDMMYSWYADKQKGNYPVIGAFDQEGTLLGFMSYGVFRVRPAYKYTIEHSVYVRSDMRGQGIGKVLLKEIIKKAEEQNYHVLIGGIDASNSASIQLHEKEGFVSCGLIKQAGYKFGKWLDLAFYQLILKTPENPEEV